MSDRDEILREILSDEDILKEYKISSKDLSSVKCSPPYENKLIEIMATIINENDNKRSKTQIYNVIKNVLNG